MRITPNRNLEDQYTISQLSREQLAEIYKALPHGDAIKLYFWDALKRMVSIENMTNGDMTNGEVDEYIKSWLEGNEPDAVSSSHSVPCPILLYQAIANGNPFLELHCCDPTAYHAGEIIYLNEFDNNKVGGAYTGKFMCKKIKHVLNHTSFKGVVEGTVILCFESGK